MYNLSLVLDSERRLKLAQVKIKNTREHEIHLNLPHRAPTIIPAAKPSELDPSKIVHGQALVDSEVLDLLADNPVIKHYFDEGWLVEVKPPQPKSKPQKDN
jgi:hypothetical protein